MKKSDTTEAMTSDIDYASRIEMEDIFSMPYALINALNEAYPNHVAWDSLLEIIGREIARIEGYPSTINDQQPYDIQHTYPLWLSPGMYESPEDHEFAMRLYWLWACSIVYNGQGKNIDTTNQHVRSMNVRLTHTFMERTKEGALRFVNSINWMSNLRIQHGLHDSGGHIKDAKEYTLRQMLLDFSGGIDEAMLITGAMLDTTELKVRLFGEGAA